MPIKGIRLGKSKTFAQPQQQVMDFLLPKTEWEPTPPVDWPDFRGQAYIGIDTETHDPNLIKRGPGFIRKDAEVVGISIAGDEIPAMYLPIRHKQGFNHDVDQVTRYLKDQLKTDVPKCGANLQYDAEALWSLGVELGGPWCDIQVAAPLIDEERSDGYSLESLAKDFLGDGKFEDELKAAASAYGVDPKGGLHHLDPRFVGEYAEFDAAAPIEIFEKLSRRICAESLEDVFNLEQRLQPVLFKMRVKGARLDMEAVHAADAWYVDRIETKKRELRDLVGYDFKFTAVTHIGRLLVERGYDNVPETMYGPSAGNDYLEANAGDLLCDLILDLRVSNKMHKDFIKMFIEENVDGRLHPNWMQLATEDGGTRSGRMASRRPNLQQIPKRNKVHGEKIRSCFIPDDGHVYLHSDFSGQEARISVEVCHRLRIDRHGKLDMRNGRPLTGAAEMVARYKENPRLDFHNMVGEIIRKVSGVSLERGPLKNLNFGILYGCGDPKVAAMLAVALQKAKDLKKIYFQGAPFLEEGVFCLQNLANDRGYIKTASGRRRRFSKFQARSWDARKLWKNHVFDNEEEARRELGDDYERAFLHKVFNAVVQGTAADQTKLAVVDLYYEHDILPLSVVHDEINVSGTPDQAPLISSVMEGVMEKYYGFEVPFIADVEKQNNWWS